MVPRLLSFITEKTSKKHRHRGGGARMCRREKKRKKTQVAPQPFLSVSSLFCPFCALFCHSLYSGVHNSPPFFCFFFRCTYVCTTAALFLVVLSRCTDTRWYTTGRYVAIARLLCVLVLLRCTQYILFCLFSSTGTFFVLYLVLLPAVACFVTTDQISGNDLLVIM